MKEPRVIPMNGKSSGDTSHGVARGGALFFGAFAMLNLFGAWRTPYFDANLWWVDLRFLPGRVGQPFLFIAAATLVWFGVRSTGARWQRVFASIITALLCLAALGDAGHCYYLLARGDVQSSFPIPLSLLFGVGFGFVLKAMQDSSAGIRPRANRAAVMLAFVACMLAFPVAQMICFGNTDYRRRADVAVVFGARAHASGRPSDALADRVRTACALYKQGTVHTLIFSGGPGDGGVIHETEVMRALAVQLGVKPEDILLDKKGVNTAATVIQTSAMLEALRAHRVLAVSHFYHLPRIKMAYQRAGIEVYTVPAEEPRVLKQLPYNLARETVAFWSYYLKPLAGQG